MRLATATVFAALLVGTAVLAAAQTVPGADAPTAVKSAPKEALFVARSNERVSNVSTLPFDGHGRFMDPDTRPPLGNLKIPSAIAIDSHGRIYVRYEGAIAVYAPGTNGNVVPVASVGNRTGLRGTGGIALDSSGKMYISRFSFSGGAVRIYAVGSRGDVTPSAVITGPSTGLHSCWDVALDSSGKIYVVNNGDFGRDDSITVYAPGSNGDVAPIATIKGPNSDLHSARAIAVGSDGKIYVTNSRSKVTNYPRITVYPPLGNSRGIIDPAPISTIGGPHTALRFPAGIALNSTGNLYVTCSDFAGPSVLIFPPDANGDVAPATIINGRKDKNIAGPAGIALDLSGRIYVAVPSDHVAVYPVDATGDAPPIATISSDNTGLDEPSALAVASNGNSYAANKGASGRAASVTVYRMGSVLDTPPIATVSGPRTKLNSPNGIAFDSRGRIYVANGGSNSINVYPLGANGDIAPSAVIKSSILYPPGNHHPPEEYVVKPIASPQFSLSHIALDSGGRIYVTNPEQSMLTVYPPLGNRTGLLEEDPAAVISGDHTGLNWPNAIALDSRENIYVSNTDAITVYPALGHNAGLLDIKPIAAIKGDNAGNGAPFDGVAVDAAGNIFAVTSVEEDTLGAPYLSYLTVYPAGSSGNVKPISKLTWNEPSAIAIGPVGP